VTTTDPDNVYTKAQTDALVGEVEDDVEGVADNLESHAGDTTLHKTADDQAKIDASIAAQDVFFTLKGNAQGADTTPVAGVLIDLGFSKANNADETFLDLRYNETASGTPIIDQHITAQIYGFNASNGRDAVFYNGYGVKPALIALTNPDTGNAAFFIPKVTVGSNTFPSVIGRVWSQGSSGKIQDYTIQAVLTTPTVAPDGTEVGYKVISERFRAGTQYTTSEQLSGNYWIDGRPIYQRTLISNGSTVAPVDRTKLTLFNYSNNSLVKSEGSIAFTGYSTGDYFNLPLADSGYFARVGNSVTGFYIELSSPGAVTCQYNVTVFYVKPA
jgi:hypothetical protein